MRSRWWTGGVFALGVLVHGCTTPPPPPEPPRAEPPHTEPPHPTPTVVARPDPTAEPTPPPAASSATPLASSEPPPPPLPRCGPKVVDEIAPKGFIGCRLDADCTVVLADCCGPCGFGMHNLYRAVNRNFVSPFERTACPMRHTGSLGGGVACPACAGGPPRGLSAVCVEHACRMQRPVEGQCAP